MRSGEGERRKDFVRAGVFRSKIPTLPRRLNVEFDLTLAAWLLRRIPRHEESPEFGIFIEPGNDA